MAENLKITIKGQGQALVLLHGWGLNSAVWQPIIEPLSKHYQVITVDLPGFGSNIANSCQPYTLENIAKAIVAAVDQAAIYIGWSLGGLVATQIALTAKHGCLGLVTVASSPQFVATEHPYWPGIKPELLAGFHQQLSVDTEKTIKNFLKIQAMGSPNIRHDVKLLQSLILQHPMPSAEVLNASLSLLETSDLRLQLNSIEQPFLRFYGRLDSLVPKQVIESIQEYSKSEYVVFDKASHAPFISHPALFIEQLQSWLTRYF